MFDKLEDLVKRLDEVMQELSEPDVVSDQNRFRNLMKEQNELAPIVEKYKEYKEAKQTIEDSVEMLEEEHDEEMRELLKEELSEAKKNVEQYEEELKVLLLPKDPTMIRTLSLRFVPVPVGMRLHYLLLRFIVCTKTMPNLNVGKQSSLM